jgi:hypothetical protein
VDTDAYIERLYRAFAKAPRPAAREITPHRCHECDEVSARLAPHAFDQVPAEDMYWLGDSLPLLSPKAFRYYLPSFVAFCLRHPESSAEAVINYNLAPSPTLDEGERDRFAYFAPEEREAIAEFVEHRARLEEGEPDRQHLEKAKEYWGVASQGGA